MKEEKLLKAFKVCYIAFFVLLIILFILAFLKVSSYAICMSVGVVTIILFISSMILYGFYSKYDHSMDWRSR